MSVGIPWLLMGVGWDGRDGEIQKGEVDSCSMLDEILEYITSDRGNRNFLYVCRICTWELPKKADNESQPTHDDKPLAKIQYIPKRSASSFRKTSPI